jgi:periodic tryptophan protein 1
VLGLAWNPAKHHVLASCSADRTVKLWDTAQQACITTYTHHSDKVNSLAWHPSEPALLLSGGFDRAACIVDVRVAAVAGEGDGGGAAAAAAVPRWSLDADTEVVCWNPHQPHHFYVSTDTVRRPPNSSAPCSQPPRPACTCAATISSPPAKHARP